MRITLFFLPVFSLYILQILLLLLKQLFFVHSNDIRQNLYCTVFPLFGLWYSKLLPWAMPLALLLIQSNASSLRNVCTHQLLRHTQVPISLQRGVFVAFDTLAIQNVGLVSPAYRFCSSMTKSRSFLFS